VIIHILISAGFYFVLMYLSVNLLGLFVRGLFPKQELERVKKETPEFIMGDDKEYLRQQRRTTLIAFILNIIYFYLLIHFWNIGDCRIYCGTYNMVEKLTQN